MLSAPVHQLRNLTTSQGRRQGTHSGTPGARHAHARRLNNKTQHYSSTDPDARIFIKPGKARVLNYLCSLAVDTARGVIRHVQADFADRLDRLHLPRLRMSLQWRLRTNGLHLRNL